MTIFPRKAAAIVGTATLALALASCTPPNENPSTLKVDTATEFEAPTMEESSSTSETTTSEANSLVVEDTLVGSELEPTVDFVG
ncbi:hypothetical protein [Corynebacterium alimapuense]|uniref:Thiamine biosynthesis protein X n=1 Tax=Corynebacterium alimapuense TaxID=1576874 RepID=A0A3M8K6Z8_9CORY|nr:hypothetical protein [Corynebacterium alimapuense]RNE48535.1 hypothetical protein C5L39_08560 [Corynebacterium alimapuense]